MPLPEVKSATAIEPDCHSSRMLRYLKELLRARQLRYADVAELLGVSEKSVKRYMAGRGVSLPVLERLCAVVGISLAELSELADTGGTGELPWTTDDQEAVLAAEPRLAIVLALLAGGWTPERILVEELAAQADLEAILVRLDRLSLITLYPHNRVRLRCRLRPVDTASEPLRRVIAKAGARVIANLDLTEPGALWRLNYARLGPASVTRVAKRLNDFLGEVAELSRQDMDLAGHQVKWYAICGLLTEHEVLGLKLLREEEAPADEPHVQKSVRPRAKRAMADQI